MNHLQTQLTPQSFNTVLAAPNVYPNHYVNSSSNTLIVRPQYANEYFEQTAFGLIDFLKQLEQDKSRSFPNQPQLTQIL